MNFDFSDEQKLFQDQIRRLLIDRCTSARIREVNDGPDSLDRDLWQALAEMGALGAAIPEAYGGLGAGYLESCLIAEELGRVLAPVPFLSSIALAAECLLLAGDEAQKQARLPALANGATIGAFSEDELSERDGKLSGHLRAVPAGDAADFVIAPAGGRLHIIDLNTEGVTRTPVPTIDPLLGHADIALEAATAEPLGGEHGASEAIARVLDRAAVLAAFEQLGGADRALEMARDYALERKAFGRAIGSFQAIKHRLADMYVAATLARSNCYYAAWALSTGADELPLAAATARVSATEAYRHCARENIQIHGGIGFTWELDCHFHYRRANRLALTLGPPRRWERRLVEHLPESFA